MELKIGVMTEKAKKAWSYFIIHASPLAQFDRSSIIYTYFMNKSGTLQ